MKNTFTGFYSLTSDELKEVWIDEKTIFIFDSNVLLNLYGYAKQTRDDFFKILEKLDSRIWLPYHVALEYQRRRLSTIRDEKSIFNKINNDLDSVQNSISKDFEKVSLERRFPELSQESDKLQKEIEKSIKAFRKKLSKWDKKQPCVRSHDLVRDIINDCFDKKIGQKPESQDWLNDLYKEGKNRYEKKIPPGFCDVGKSKNEGNAHFSYAGLEYERQYGDLIIWQQILEKAKNNDISSVVLITDDLKDDWWYNLESNGKKQVGPLADLQEEIYTNSNINSFHMYSTATFLEEGKTNLDVQVKSSSIEDASISEFQQAVELSRKQKMFALEVEASSQRIRETAERARRDHEMERAIAVRNHEMAERDRINIQMVERNREIFERGREFAERGRDIFERGDEFAERDLDIFERDLDIFERNHGLAKMARINSDINRIKKTNKKD